MTEKQRGDQACPALDDTVGGLAARANWWLNTATGEEPRTFTREA